VGDWFIIKGISVTNRIQKIVIVGGGTAGWLAAAYLNRALNRTGPHCHLTLIESSDIGTIGVGETTIPTLRHTFNFLGFAEAEWMVECNATFTMGLKLINWVRGNDFFWFPFQPESPQASYHQIDSAGYWLQQRLAGGSEPFSPLVSSAVYLCQNQKAPKSYQHRDYEAAVNHGYHLDAGLLASYLKKKAIASGVTHVVDRVVEVVLAENGFISHLLTEQHGPLAGDLFIDCSGFRGVLINQALQEPFISFNETLFCDRAVAILLPTPDANQGLNPYTTSTALSAGWAFRVPLFNRSGNGYVYASDFLSPDQAEQELRRHLGTPAQGIKARHLTTRIGHTRRSWVKNCVSLGLAAGFVEPLKSTGIFLIEMGLQHLLQNFPDKQFSPSLSDKYNRLMIYYYEEFRDFIVLHYYLNQRTDSDFWRAMRYRPVLSDQLQARLEQYRSMLPSLEDALDFGLLGHILPYGYTFLLAGMEYLPKQSAPILAYDEPQAASRTFAATKTEAEQLSQSLPDHYSYLCQLRLSEALRTVI
jgi:hypothetical protein